MKFVEMDHGIQCLFSAMGGQGELRIHDDEKSIEQLKQICLESTNEICRIEDKYSRYKSSSVISQINQNSGVKPTPIDEETFGLLKFANELHQNSNGLFDITSGILRRIWDFNTKKIPSDQEINQLIPLISWSSIVFNSDEIYLPQKKMEIDFGGFGKEYAADCAAKKLLLKNIKSGYVNLAGDIRVVGPKRNGDPWQMGIQNPRLTQKLIASIPIHQGALTTSGDYERYFIHEGIRYSHILRPDTGYPVTFWQSVSVLAPLCIVAGSCSTIAMLFQDKGLSYLDSTGFSYLAIDQNSNIYKK